MWRTRNNVKEIGVDLETLVHKVQPARRAHFVYGQTREVAHAVKSIDTESQDGLSSRQLRLPAATASSTQSHARQFRLRCSQGAMQENTGSPAARKGNGEEVSVIDRRCLVIWVFQLDNGRPKRQSTKNRPCTEARW